MDELNESMLARIDAYVDGWMDAEDRVSFEAEMSADGRIRDEVERLRGVDRALQAEFGGLAERGTGAESAPDRFVLASRRLVIPMGIAALLLLAVGLFSLRGGGGAGGPASGPAIDGSVVLTAFIRDPQPTVVCDTEAKFIAYTQEKLGHAITARFDAGVALIGWRGVGVYEDSDPVAPRVLLARGAGGEPAVVVFQRRDSAAPVVPGARPGMRVHRATFGSVEAWEFSGSETPIVLGVLRSQG